MQQPNLSIKIDENDKKKFENFCSETGLSTSVALNIFIKAVIRENKFPFEIKSDPFYSESNMKYHEKVISDINAGKARFEEHQIVEDDD